jgi:glycerol kinase
VDKGNSNSFQVKKLKEYMQNMEGEGKLTREQEIAFKNRDTWTYNELTQACTSRK